MLPFAAIPRSPAPGTPPTRTSRSPAVSRPLLTECSNSSKKTIPKPSRPFVLPRRLALSLRPWLAWYLHALVAAALALVLSPPPPLPAHASPNDGRLKPKVPYPCEDVGRYYGGLDGLAGDELMAKLSAIVSPHASLRYKDVWDALKILDAADADYPEASSEVVEIYSQRAVPKLLAGKPDGWNREHLWPRSYGLTYGPSLTDLHNIRPADVNVNSSRGNKYYGECAATSIRCMRPANHEAAPDTETDGERWTPPFQKKFQVLQNFPLIQRLSLLEFQRDGRPPSMIRCNLSRRMTLGSWLSCQLIRRLFVANRSSRRKRPFHKPKRYMAIFVAKGYNKIPERRKMGLLSALLQWNELDPPSKSEQLRNDRVCSLYQHNRNPFVDHPEFANLIWRNPPAKSPTLVRKSPKAWVNEFHYENKGKDVNEVHHPLIHHFFLQFVELVIHTSLDVKDLMLVLYNGANGRMYDSLNLSNKEAFIVTESSSGYLIYTTFTTLQNGPADGIALVYCTGGSEIEILEFISYEGILRAHDGPAKGIVSVDVMLKETDESSEQDSLGLAGRKIGEFAWRKLSGNASPGKLNAGQMF